MTGAALVVLPFALAGLSGCEQIPIPRANTTAIHIPPPVPAATNVSGGTPAAAANDPQSLPPLPQSATSLGETPKPPVLIPLRDDALALATFEERKTPEVEAAAIPAAPIESEPEPEAKLPPHADEAPAADPPQPTSDDRAATDLKSSADVASLLKPSDSGARKKAVVIDPEKPTAAPAKTPRQRWDEGLSHLRTLAGDQEKSSASEPGPWPLRARLLDEISKDDDASLWMNTITALAKAQSKTTPDERVRASEIRNAVLVLEDESPLEVSDLRLCRKVKGFGNFEPIDSKACKRGQALIVYCEMSGLHYVSRGEMRHSRLSARVALTSAEGGETRWSQELGTAEDVCRHRRRDYYVNYRITLPESLPPGEYSLTLTQNDEIAGRSASAAIPVTIHE